MLSRAMLDQARRVAWRCRPRMSGARAQAWARADRDTFGISRDDASRDQVARRAAGAWEGSGDGVSGRRCPEDTRARRATPPPHDEAGRSDAAERRRFWWKDREG